MMSTRMGVKTPSSRNASTLGGATSPSASLFASSPGPHFRRLLLGGLVISQLSFWSVVLDIGLLAEFAAKSHAVWGFCVLAVLGAIFAWSASARQIGPLFDGA